MNISLNSQQSTINSQQSTINSQQSTVNSQQSTVNAIFQLGNPALIALIIKISKIFFVKRK
ncbi:hypothetical protein H6G33_30365 [Calothrix sp. FACHB-1219]|uniref:hypothetical protein n=1 Tax=unclassified Calothrix TaxID=2619626 RepID=UPI001688EB9E|nr:MULTISPECIES: hypothetical protein [unclassified Calothrix]MBD2206484.1 hypothetical protein [Calothrix sp. FACHB-168]MBD2221280.1 hypothetical protein [Calothrix sp. FACHB-1219]